MPKPIGGIQGITTAMQKNCQDCVYYSKSIRCCDYADIENHSRPCKPGDKCTVKVVGELVKTKTIKPLKPVPRDEWELYMYGRSK